LGKHQNNTLKAYYQLMMFALIASWAIPVSIYIGLQGRTFIGREMRMQNGGTYAAENSLPCSQSS
jgi:hypothetical protein